MPGFTPDLLATLTDAVALRTLFIALGYQPQTQVAYSARTLDWPANVAVELHGRVFEVLADADDGFFQVLVLPPQPEIQGLTDALVQRLYATLEQRGCEAILVLPAADWGTLELVLLVDLRPLDDRNGLPTFLRFSFDARALRPHQQVALGLLDVHATGPGEAMERVTRAFRRAQQERFFRSVNCFSTYYLERRIFTDTTPTVQATWTALAAQMPALQSVLAGADATRVLTSLGWTLVPSSFAGQPARLGCEMGEVALVAVLPPEHPLDQQISETSYPQLELLAALEQERQNGGLTWAILTNGRTWRLYSHLTASISGAFYEVDLSDLLAFGSTDDLRYLAAFFGAVGLSGPFVGAVFASSQMLAKEVGENLKQVVFRDVFGLLANALADDLKRRGAYDGSDDQRRLIFRTTMILLYRILFVLYAESMRLLPTLYPPYYANSLTYLLSDIALQPFTAPHLRKPQTPTAYWAWDRLRDLFAAISAGRPEWGVPKYNGGLFSDGAAVDGVENPHKAPHRLLAEVRLGAIDMCKALDWLGRDPVARAAKTQDEVRRLIDYAGLDVRRLGSIYEGLLEFQLVETPAGDLALKHTREERKASGSYYTPEYIVAYIVEQAVGPVLDERARQFAAIMERLPTARREVERATRAEADQRVSIATAKAKSDAARATLAQMEHAAVESLLDLKILDPAMGSGHFLVSAVNFVTDRLIVILDRHRTGNPMLARLEGIRTQIRASLQAQGVDALIADEQLNNVNLLRRLVMKRCVFGVDLNAMAVELARLSLWLNSFTVGAPLNFLDHHLKWGNALIGARVQAVQQAMEGTDAGGQLAMFTGGSAFKEMLDVTRFIEELVEIADANAQQVEQSETLYRAYEQSVVPVKRLLDLWVSRSFGSKEANELTTLYSGSSEVVLELKVALMSGAPLAHPSHQRALDRARELFAQHRFLHWDLDFPEVFIDIHTRAWKPVEQMGFDAVVGNPPYLNAWAMTELDDFAREAIIQLNKYPELLEGHWDLYAAFITRSLENTRKYGQHSFIIPDAFAREKYAHSLREYILKTTQLKEIMHFEGLNVFDDVSRHCIVYSISNQPPDGRETKVVTPVSERAAKIEIGGIHQAEWLATEGSQIRIRLADPVFRNIVGKISRQSIKVGQFCYVMVGATTHSKDKKSFTKATILSMNPIGNAKRFFDGQNVSRYAINWDGRYIDYRRTEMYGPRVPELFESEKVIVRDVTGANEQLIVAYDDTKMYCDHLVTCVTYYENVGKAGVQTEFEGHHRIAKPYPSLKFLCAVIASRTVTWYFREVFATGTLQGSYSHTYPQQVRAFPIRRIAFTTPTAERAALVDEAKRALASAPTQSGAGATDWRGWRVYWAALWAWAEARLPQLADGTPDTAHEQSDAIHDLLAHLAERMIELHKQKQAEAATFTDWLEQATGSAIETWSLKTVVQSFWEQPWDELERALQKNRGKCMQAAGLRGKQADIAMEPLVRVARGHWEVARRGLVPTIAAIRATDRLIDLLVYRLYGLTEGEIDLVEG